jgi:hypothetical protein
MKTIKELQAEVLQLEKEAKDISTKVDLQANYKGIDSFSSKLVMDNLNSLASYHENLFTKYINFSQENLNDSSVYWQNESEHHYNSGVEIRKTITHLIRTQKEINRNERYNEQNLQG